MNEDRHGILPAPGFTGNAICGCDPMWLGKATESGEDSIEQGSGNEKRPADAGLSDVPPAVAVNHGVRPADHCPHLQ